MAWGMTVYLNGARCGERVVLVESTRPLAVTELGASLVNTGELERGAVTRASELWGSGRGCSARGSISNRYGDRGGVGRSSCLCGGLRLSLRLCDGAGGTVAAASATRLCQGSESRQREA
jgi:hypothetical protein